jgi:hypothetical protein
MIYHVEIMANKVKFKLDSQNLNDFISKLDELSKIDDTIKIKIDSENILMYSMLGGNVLLAFKNYLLKTEDYLDKTDFDYKIDLIIPNSKKVVKNLAFIKDQSSVTLEMTYKESPDDDNIYLVRSFQIVSGKFKVNWLSGEHYEVRDIDKNSLSSRLDLKNKKWSFGIKNEEFLDIKKLSNINSERVLSITVNKGNVTFSEKSAWELELESIDVERNANLILNKRFLSCINDKLSHIDFHIFDTFMLIKDVDSNLMLSFEQDFSDD